MNLKTLVWLAAISYTLVIGGSLLMYRLFVVFPAIENSVLEMRQNDLFAIRSTYFSERDNLTRLNRDWAKWDDTFEFINKGDMRLAISDILRPSFLKTNIDGAAFLNVQGETLFAAQKSNGQFIRVKSVNELSPDIDIQSILDFDHQYGIIRHNNNLAFFVSHRIQDSQEIKPSNGTLIFIRAFKKDFFERLNIISGLKFNVNYDNNKHAASLPTMRSFKINTIRESYIFSISNRKKKIIATGEIIYPKGSAPQILDGTTVYSILALLVLPIFITVIIYYLFLIPITSIANSVNYMKKRGDVLHLTHTSHIVEINSFLHTFNSLVDKIKAYQQKLLDDSNSDGLTGIYNRKYFDSAFDKAWRMSSRHHSNISLIMMDIDYFKKYNDHYGHLQGDEALKKVAQALHTVTKRADDTLARYGGEEFVIIFQAENMLHLQTALNAILESIRALAIEHEPSSINHMLTISCGACLIENAGSWMKSQKENALKMADDALYDAKTKGRDRFSIRVFDATCQNDQPSDTP